jgi:hypothetical protein
MTNMTEPVKIPIKVGVYNRGKRGQMAELIEEKESHFTLLPCKPGVCQECATAHEPEQPHNQQSLYYQYHFYAQTGRWPTWADAMDHCLEEVKAAWVQALRERGEEVTPDA